MKEIEKEPIGNAKCNAVELCELGEIVNEVRGILSECQVFKGLAFLWFQSIDEQLKALIRAKTLSQLER